MSKTGISIPSSDLKVTASTYVDAVYGDDSTGAIDRFDLPFKTINAGVNAATAGGSGEHNVFIRPGLYNEQVITNAAGSVTILNIHYETGALHYYTGAADGAIYKGTGNRKVNIYGRGEFLRAGTSTVDAYAFGAFGVIIEIHGAKSIRSTQNSAIGAYVSVILNIDLIESTAGIAIGGNTSRIIRNIGTLRSTTSKAIDAINGSVILENVKLIESTVTWAAAGVGGLNARNCNFRGLGALVAYGQIIIEQGSVDCVWDSPNGHGIQLTHPNTNYVLRLKDVTIKCANTSAYSIHGSTQIITCKAQNVAATNPTQPSVPGIMRFLPTNPEVGDVYRIDATGSVAFIDYTVQVADTIIEVLAGLKTAWLAEIGSGNEFDLYIGKTAANSGLLNVSSGTEMVVTSVTDAIVTQVSGGFNASVVDAGGVLVPTFGDIEAQQISGVLMLVEDIFVDENVTIDLVI